MLFYRNWKNSDILFVWDLMDGKGFLPVNELSATILFKDGRWNSQYARIRRAIQSLGNMLVLADMNVEHRENMKFRSAAFVYDDIILIEDMISVRQLTVKRIYHELIKTKIEESRAEEFWRNTLEIEYTPVWSDVWLFRLKVYKTAY